MGREIQRVIVDRAFQRGGFESYADLAARLGVSAPTLSQWRLGGNPIPERRLQELCEISGDDAGVYAMALMAEQTNIISLRKSIQSVLRDAGRKLPTSALAAFLVLAATLLPGVGARYANAADTGAFRVIQPAMPIMSIRRFVTWALRSLKRRKRRHAYLLALQG